MKGKDSLGKKIRHALELDELMISSDSLTLSGTGMLTVRGCEGIIEYGEGKIKLSMKEYILTILGERLYCASFYSGAITIEGEISSLEIQKRGKKR